MREGRRRDPQQQPGWGVPGRTGPGAELGAAGSAGGKEAGPGHHLVNYDRRPSGGRAWGRPEVFGARLRRKVPGVGKGSAGGCGIPAELGALRWEPPQGKAALTAPGWACDGCGANGAARPLTPWSWVQPGRRAGWERGWGLAGQHLTATARGLSAVPHRPGL